MHTVSNYSLESQSSLKKAEQQHFLSKIGNYFFALSRLRQLSIPKSTFSVSRQNFSFPPNVIYFYNALSSEIDAAILTSEIEFLNVTAV